MITVQQLWGTRNECEFAPHISKFALGVRFGSREPRVAPRHVKPYDVEVFSPGPCKFYY